MACTAGKGRTRSYQKHQKQNTCKPTRNRTALAEAEKNCKKQSPPPAGRAFGGETRPGAKRLPWHLAPAVQKLNFIAETWNIRGFTLSRGGSPEKNVL